MDRIKNIEYMESILNKHKELLNRLSSCIDEFENSQSEYSKLFKYYGSEVWWKDREGSNNGEFPLSLRCGVLSEDEVFDLIGENFHMAIRFLDLANKILKGHFGY